MARKTINLINSDHLISELNSDENIFLTIDKIKKFLIQKGWRLITNESASCGAIANLIGNISGISQIYYGGLVVYSEEMKHRFLKISKPLLKKYGTISTQCITKMLVNAQKISKCEVILAITGNAGPLAIEDKANAYFEFGIMINNQIFLSSKKYCDEHDRNLLRNNIGIHILKTLYILLKKYF